MSYGIQPQTVTLSELILDLPLMEEIAPHQEGLEEGGQEGALTTSSKPYAFTLKAPASSVKTHFLYLHMKAETETSGTQSTYKDSRSFLYFSSVANKSTSTTRNSAPVKGASPQEVESGSEQTTLSSHRQAVLSSKFSLKESTSKTTLLQASRTAITHEKKGEPSSENKNLEAKSLKEYQFVKKETAKWWESRYQKKEREGGGQQQGRRDQEQSAEEEKKALKKKEGICSALSATTELKAERGSKAAFIKPRLELPRIGVFALYYILTKMGISSDGISHFESKKEVEYLDVESTEIHKKRLEELKEAVKKEKETEGWGVMIKVFSWLGSLFGILAGIAMIVTGVGAFAGALLLVGGTLQLANQVMEMTGGWKKVAELLPGDDTEKKRAVVTWMQIGVAVLSLILAGLGVVFGGFANVQEGMGMITSMIGGVATIGFSVSLIGSGITQYFYKNSLANVQRWDLRLMGLKHTRKDIMEKLDIGVDHLEKLFEELARALEFEEELFQADQMVNRR